MNEDQHIETLFRDTFDQYEVDVQPEAWANIQSQVQAGAAGASSGAAGAAGASKGFWGSLASYMMGAATITTVAVVTVYMIPSDSNVTTDNTPAPIEQQVTKPAQSETPALSASPEENNKTIPSASVQQAAEEGKNPAPTVKQAERAINSETPQPIVAPSRNGSSPTPPASASAGGEGEVTANTTAQGSEANNRSSAQSAPAQTSPQEANPTNTASPDVTTESVQPESSNETPRVVKAVITAEPAEGLSPLTVNFSNQTEAVSYFWYFGDGSTSNEAAPMYTYNDPGAYEVTLLVVDDEGNRITDKQMIRVNAAIVGTIDKVPNIFSPNGDGMNDLLVIQTSNLINYQVTILDRAGVQVFQSNSIDNPWNGYLPSGEMAPTGNYFVVVTATGIDGQPVVNKGQVTLVR